MTRNPLRPLSALAVLLLLGGFAAGCGQKTETTENTTTDSTAMGGTAPALSDANIAAIVVAANDADIEAGQMAESKTKNADVKQFAQTMQTDHKAVNEKAKDLAGRLNLNPEDNDASRQLKDSSERMRDSLKTMDGAAFDRAYIDNEVTYHQAVLDMLDSQLIPSAQNAELKQLLNDTRPAIAQHLDHAKQVQAKLGASSSR